MRKNEFFAKDAKASKSIEEEMRNAYGFGTTDEDKLLKACEWANYDHVIYLLPKLKDKNHIGYSPVKSKTPLYVACEDKENKRSKIVEALLKNNANPELLCETVSGVSSSKEAPIHAAASAHNVDTVKLLLQHKVGVDQRDAEGKTPLMHAINLNLHNQYTSSSLNMVRFLLREGAEVNAVTINNQTALYYAACYQNETILTFLLENRADPRMGESPLKAVLLQLGDGKSEDEKANIISIAKKLINSNADLAIIIKNKPLIEFLKEKDLTGLASLVQQKSNQVKSKDNTDDKDQLIRLLKEKLRLNEEEIAQLRDQVEQDKMKAQDPYGYKPKM